MWWKEKPSPLLTQPLVTSNTSTVMQVHSEGDIFYQEELLCQNVSLAKKSHCVEVNVEVTGDIDTGSYITILKADMFYSI